MRAIFLNDHRSLNNRYRAQLISKFKSHGFTVCSVGLKDTVVEYLRILISSYRSRDLIISSNMRCNLFSLCLFRHRTICVILNGFGRFRGRRWARISIATLFASRARVIAVQNYADYRYLKRYYSPGARLKWICGSGGSKRRSGQSKGVFSVSRESKLVACSKSVIDYCKSLGANSQVTLVGCDEVPSSLRQVRGNLVAVGFVNQENILTFGDELLIFGGYGDGFPHVAADALVSGLPIILPVGEYIRFGLRVIGASKERILGRWIRVDSTERLRCELSNNVVSERYYEYFLNQVES